MTVQVTDVNDNAPLFPTHSYQAVVALDDHVGTHVLLMSASDPDGGNNGRVLYKITSGNEKNVFEMNENSGLISLKEDPSKFFGDKFVLTVKATDSGEEPRSDTATVTINVFSAGGVPDFPPSPWIITVPEGILPGERVALVRAGTSEFLFYELLSGREYEAFVLDPFTGELLANKTMDYEEKPRYFISVGASDKEGHTDEVEVIIQLQDLNDNAPEFFDEVDGAIIRTVEVAFEHEGDFVTQVEAFDRDADDVLSYEISGEEGLKYLTVGDKGKLRVKSSLGDLLQLRFTLTARDNATKPHATSVDVQLFFTVTKPGEPPIQGSVPEDAAVGTVVLQLPRYFPGGTFSIVLPQVTPFSVDDQGRIILAEEIDFEAKRAELLTVREMSATGEQRNDGTVEISVLDVNDNDPTLQPGRSYARVNENARAGVAVLQLNAYDRDAALNGLSAFQLETENTPFAVNPHDTMLEVGLPLGDEERREQYALKFFSYDYGLPHRKTNPFELFVDVSRLPPSFTNLVGGGFKFEVSEGASGGVLVGRIEAVSHAGAQIGYEITDGDPDKMFAISALGGEIRVNAHLDYETQTREYNLEVWCVELMPGGLRSHTRAQISVTNANDHLPSFEKKVYTVSTPEDTEPGEPVLTVAAKDCDCSEDCTCSDGQVKYYVEDTEFFTAHPDTGVITPAMSLDYESKRSYVFRVVARDTLAGHTNTAVAYVNVSVTNSNDNVPEFEKNPYRIHVDENVKPDEGFALIMARDADGGVLKYSVIGAGPFQIDTYSGILSASTSLPIDKSKYTFTVRVTDGVYQADTYVIVDVDGVNQNRPEFVKCESASLRENLPPGQFVTQVSGRDKDRGKNGEVEYFLVSGHLDFVIDNTTGVIRSKTTFDREEKPFFILVVMLEDAGHGRSSSEGLLKYCELTVSIVDVNDWYPIFPSQTYEASIYKR